ncbi:MAG: type II toxin-antitoxin system HicB family antitoxin [Elusimicrobia bacterium]|nr:type II toxin-antitoxin system HicB family antitoxin [Elusimicrobiota bacterium]
MPNQELIKVYLSALPFVARVTPDKYGDDRPCYLAEHPELPGCMSHGDTPEEAIANLEDACKLYIEDLLERGLLPQAIPPKSTGITASYSAPGTIWRVINVDIVEVSQHSSSLIGSPL